MPEIFLHIGRHKSGTSSLQHFFASNAETLKRLGYHYPEAMRQGIAHHKLANFFSDKHLNSAEDTQEYQRFCQEIQQAEHVIISSEALQNLHPSQIKPHLQGSVNIIVYIREQAEYAISSYAQAVQNQKITLSFKEYEAKRFNADYARFLAAWESTFGRDAITVKLYDRKEFAGGDVCLDFLSVLGLANTKEQFCFSQQDRNPSIGGSLLEFKRRLNALDFEAVISKADMYKLLGEVASYRPAVNQGAFWDEALLAAIEEKYQATNDAVLKQYFPHRERLFTVNSKLYDTDKNALSFAEIADTIDDIQPGLGRRLLQLITDAT